MNIRFTLTAVLDDRLWGFSELLGSRNFNETTRREIEELILADIYSVVDGGAWSIEPCEEFREGDIRSYMAAVSSKRFKTT